MVANLRISFALSNPQGKACVQLPWKASLHCCVEEATPWCSNHPLPRRQLSLEQLLGPRRACPRPCMAQKATQQQSAVGRWQQLDHNLSLKLYEQVGMKLPRGWMMLLEHSGSGVLWLPLVPLLWLATSQKPATRAGWANTFLLLWADIVFTGLLKAVFRRKRPIYNHAGDFVVVVAVDQYSFPSGHAARVSCLAALACVLLGPHHWGLAAGAVLWAVVVAVSRAAMGRHYLGDVTAGLLLGLVTAATVTRGQFSAAGCWISAAASERLHHQVWAAISSYLG